MFPVKHSPWDTGAGLVRPPSLAVLGERYGLDDRQLDQLDAVLDGLAKDEHAPTTVRDPEEAVDVHLADSLVALEVDRLRSAQAHRRHRDGRRLPGAAAGGCAAEERDTAGREPVEEVPVSTSSDLRRRGSTTREWSSAGQRSGPRVWAHTTWCSLERLRAPAVVLEYAAPLLRAGGHPRGLARLQECSPGGGRLQAAEQLGLRARGGTQGRAVRGGERPPPAPVCEGLRDPRTVSETGRGGPQTPARGLRGRPRVPHFPRTCGRGESV